ncbi:MAG TPA: hypothetical protein VGP13_03580 [Candidatus Paceibacterota bacterium]|jgi:hypothetical protein|nr:hypothetical protein [Candidatus Paceibacterota bacterium]
MATSSPWLFLAGAALLLAAAVVFAGSLVWYIHASKHAPSFSIDSMASYDRLGPESAIPHHASGGILGEVVSVGPHTMTIRAIPPGLAAAPKNAVLVTVVVVSDTVLYRPGEAKNAQVYADEIESYKTYHEPTALAPNPYVNVALTLADFPVDSVVSVLPKIGSGNGLVITAEQITPAAL